MAMHGSRTVATKEQRNYLMRLFERSSKPYRKLFYTASALQMISIALSDIVSPFIISRILVDLASKERIDSVDPYIPAMIALVIVEIISLVGRRLATYVEERFDAKSRRAVVSDIFARLLEHPAYFHQNRFVGTTITLISKCSDCFGRTSGLFVFVFLALVTNILGAAIVLIPRVPIYFIVLMTVAVVYTFVVSKLLPYQMKLSSDASETSSRMYGVMSDAVSNIGAVKSESGEDFEFERVRQIGDEWLVLNKKFARRVLIWDSIISNSFMRSLRVLSVVIAVIVSVGEQTDVSHIYLATTLTLSFLMHLWGFADALYELTVSYGDAAPLVPLLMENPGVADKQDAKEMYKAQGSIVFSHVTYQYPNTESPVFDNLNLSITSGEKVGVVGRSGAGKSTLVKLIMRFVDPSEGVISVDKSNISDVTQESLRSNIAYVAQEPMLFHRSVFHNITYGVDDVTDEQIHNVLERSHSLEFISELPKGLKSIVGERGVNLSGGQRQRIAIARAMLKNAPILILDEATSALDSESEGYVQSAFSDLMSDRTTLVIAHRLSTLLNMDRILVFDHGEIIEQGSHADLVDAGGIYAGLWEHQAGGFINEG